MIKVAHHRYFGESKRYNKTQYFIQIVLAIWLFDRKKFRAPPDCIWNKLQMDYKATCKIKTHVEAFTCDQKGGKKLQKSIIDYEWLFFFLFYI